jgi:REP element-mobilizing transposase RayT
MPRARRLDAPGAYHHIVARGVERRTIFLDDADLFAFVGRLERLVLELGFVCSGWSLIANHFHLLLRRMGTPLAKLMARLNGPFAQGFNRRYGRVGHLFQGRFASRMVNDDTDLAGVAKYVLFNPVRHGIVPAERLSAYRWCAYGAVIGARPAHAFEDVDDLVRILGGDLHAVRALLRRDLRALAPEPSQLERLAALIRDTCRRERMPRESLGGRGAAPTRAREQLSVVATKELGIRASDLARSLGVSEAAIHRALARATDSQRKKGV